MSSSNRHRRNGRRPRPHNTPSNTLAAPASVPVVLDRKAAGGENQLSQPPAAAFQRAEATGAPVTVRVRGVDVDLDPAAIASWDFVQAMVRAEQGDMTALVVIVDLLLGDARDDMIAALRDPITGRVPLDAVGEVITELMQAADLGN